jgi:4-amino-4-deoxy-L-arabinose transferase-like glycosyltransferase
MQTEHHPLSQHDTVIAWALSCVAFVALWATEQAAGFVRDESVYFAAGESYAAWVSLLFSSPTQALSDASIVRFFDVNHEHPALMKLLFGLSHSLFHQKLGWMRPAAAFRLPAFACAALIAPLTYLLSRERFSRAASAFAAISFFCVPRQFFEAHLSCFDVPIAAMWLLTVFCFLRALRQPRYWLYTGLAFGAAVATKHNGFFLPAVLVPISLFIAWNASAEKPRARTLFLQINGLYLAGLFLFGILILARGTVRGAAAAVDTLSPATFVFVSVSVVAAVLCAQLSSVDTVTFRAMASLVSMASAGPLIFYAHWPYLWHHPIDRALWYFEFHATHNHYAWFYLGEVLRAPPFPWAYVLVKTVLTVPTSLMVCMTFGSFWALRRVFTKQGHVFETLMLLNAAASIALISLPNVPHFGGVKHWFPSMPFLAIMSAGVVDRAGDVVVRFVSRIQPWKTAVTVTLSLLILSPAVVATARVYAFGTSAYAELAGGLPGAASLGMQRQFWANNVTGVLDYLNANAKPGERVYLHENHGGQIHDYQRNAMLRRDLQFVGSPFEADWVAYQYHQEFREHEYNTWQAFDTVKPVFGLYLDETPQVVVYQRQRR